MSNISAPFQLLELNVISAQDLAPVTRNMRTYAVAWVHPDRKLSTRVDTQGHTNPTWNDKFVFRVDEEFLYSDTSAIMVEIYGLHWFKDVHVGTVRVLVANLIPPPGRQFHNNRAPLGMRFAALQVRRASGRPQGILNVGVAVLDSSMRSMPLYTHNSSAVAYRHLMGEKDAYDSHNHIMSPQIFGDSNNNNRTARAAAGRERPLAPRPMMMQSRPELRRTKSDTSSMMGSEAVVVRRMATQGRANSAHSESVVSGSGSSNASGSGSNKMKGKRRSKGRKGNSNDDNSSVVSGSSDGRKSGRGSTSILSGSRPWKLKKNKDKEIYTQSVSDDMNAEVEQSPPFYHREDDDYHTNGVMYIDNGGGGGGANGYSSVDTANTVSEDATDDSINTNHSYGQGHAMDVAASPKHQFRGSPVAPPPQYISSPAPKFRNSPTSNYISSSSTGAKVKNSPKPQFQNSPKPQFQNSPKPQFQNSPKPQLKNSPKPQLQGSPQPQLQDSPKRQFQDSPQQQFQESPKPQFQNSPQRQFQDSPKRQFQDSPQPQFQESPKPQFQNSPQRQFQDSPKRQFQNSPKPQFQNSPMPQFQNSPMPQFQNSPMPQFQNSSMPQFQNSPMPQYQNSPKPLFQNSPKPHYRDSPAQYRSSPAVSNFNPPMGYGSSNRGTPMQNYGYTPRMSSTAFEYMTPRRSNLAGNMGPVVITESELGPSASEVAAAMARMPMVDEGDNSTVGGWSLDESVEGLQSKLERWRTELPPVADRSEFSSFRTPNSKTASHHSRRKTDSGLFSCFGTICGVECSIMCGDPKDKKKNGNGRRRTSSVDDASFL